MLDINTIDYDFCIDTSIENNMKEVLQFAEDNYYKWIDTKNLPTNFDINTGDIIFFYPKEKVITHGYINNIKKEHKLSDFQSEFNEELIKELREGKIVLRNDGNPEDLKKVLKYAFPEDQCKGGGHLSFYTSSPYGNFWKGWTYKPNLIICSLNNFLKTNKTMENRTFEVTRAQLKKIHDIACYDWKNKISKLTTETIDTFSEKGVLTYQQVKEMFDAANTDQTKVLKEIFPNYQEQEFIPNGELAWVRDGNYDEWYVRFSDGKGGFYQYQQKKGFAIKWRQVRKFSDNPLI